MAALRFKNAAVLSKEETTEGVDAVPTAGSNGILVENVQVQFNPNIIETDEVTGSLDSRGPIAGGMSVQVSFDVYLKGSGAAATPPEWGELLKPCGWAETITAAAFPAAAEAAATGTDTAAVTLATGATGVADEYNGMPITLTASGVSVDTFIADYSSSKTATLAEGAGVPLGSGISWQVPVNVLYAPASASIPSHTQYFYMDGVLYKFVGMRGTFSIELVAGQPGKLRFQMQGLFSAKTDSAVPTVTYDSTRPPVWKGGKCKINRLAAAVANLSVDVGNELALPDDPNAAEGFQPAQITRRRMTGSADPLETLVATRDIMTAFRSGTQQIILAQVGSTAGNRYGLVVPEAFYTNQTPGERSGLATVTVPFSCVGQDSGAYLCIY